MKVYYFVYPSSIREISLGFCEHSNETSICFLRKGECVLFQHYFYRLYSGSVQFPEILVVYSLVPGKPQRKAETENPVDFLPPFLLVCRYSGSP